jgi:hypothetical protein
MATYSGFQMTICSNQNDPKYKEPFRQAIINLTENIGDYLKFVSREPDPENIESIQVYLPHNAEPDTIFNKKKNIHIHFVVVIRHNSKIQFDSKKIQRFIAKEINVNNTYANAKYIPESEIKKAIKYNNRHVIQQLTTNM